MNKHLSDNESVKLVESLYPEMTNEFKKIMIESYETFCKKTINYGTTNISVGTSLQSATDIKLSLMGLFFRKNDKVQRLKQMVVLGNADEVGESISDTYQDLGVYSIISQIVQRDKWGK